MPCFRSKVLGFPEFILPLSRNLNTGREGRKEGRKEGANYGTMLERDREVEALDFSMGGGRRLFGRNKRDEVRLK